MFLSNLKKRVVLKKLLFKAIYPSSVSGFHLYLLLSQLSVDPDGLCGTSQVQSEWNLPVPRIVTIRCPIVFRKCQLKLFGWEDYTADHLNISYTA